MPLAFDTLNRGTVAFGFFNIDVDMVLLDHYFFFADTFCALVSGLAKAQIVDGYQDQFDAYVIEEDEAIGDLMGAIHGTHYQGLIGDVYRLFPFPVLPEEFKQKPDGYINRPVVEAIVRGYATVQGLPFLYEPQASRITIGDYQFSEDGFAQLIRYVWYGGAPRWRASERPSYVTDMIKEISQSRLSFLKVP